MNNKRVQSGYDLEINLGGEFFKKLVSAAYDSKKIPSEIVFGKNKIEISKPKDVSVSFKVEKADLEVVVDIKYSGLKFKNIKIYLGVKVTDKQIILSYVCLDDDTQKLLKALNKLDIVDKKLKKAIHQKIDSKMISNKVDEFDIIKVKRAGSYEDAIILLLNLKIKINSQSQWPEKKYISRGDKKKAVSILPKGHSFYIGVAKDTFLKLANHTWHSLGEEVEVIIPFTNKKQKIWTHPIRKKNGDNVGYFTSVGIKPKKGYIELKLKGVVNMKYWSDADIETVFHITPTVKNKKLKVDIKLTKFDADSGILGDIFSFLIGGFIGAIIGFLAGGPVGAVIGIGIGAVGGVVSLEITEAILESSFSNKIEDKAQEANIFSIFSSLPLKTKVFTDSSDDFFDKEFYLENYFTDLKTDLDGLSFGGNSKVTTNIETLDLVIKKIFLNSTSEFKKYQGIEKIEYSVKRNDKKTIRILEMGEILKRAEKNKIKRGALYPQKIHREKRVVKLIKFKYSIILSITQTVFLQEKGVSYVVGYNLVKPKKGSPYFRGQKDDRIDNNFESLPEFD